MTKFIRSIVGRPRPSCVAASGKKNVQYPGAFRHLLVFIEWVLSQLHPCLTNKISCQRKSRTIQFSTFLFLSFSITIKIIILDHADFRF
jgi:hypothetical protein